MNLISKYQKICLKAIFLFLFFLVQNPATGQKTVTTQKDSAQISTTPDSAIKKSGQQPVQPITKSSKGIKIEFKDWISLGSLL